jgi:ribonuclease T2
MRWMAPVVLLVAAVGFWVWQGADERPGADGYYVLAVSWTPSWCAQEGTARGDARCAPGAGKGWLVHGLWPQHEDGGWPEFCASSHAAPEAALLASMHDVMGSEGLAAHQWRKHGTCSGLSPTAYFAQTRMAFEALEMPDAIRARDNALRMTSAEILSAFRGANPSYQADMVVLTCRNGAAQELRLCLTRDLSPKACDAELLARGCRTRELRLPAKP